MAPLYAVSIRFEFISTLHSKGVYTAVIFLSSTATKR